jgi:hypothetical protein
MSTSDLSDEPSGGLLRSKILEMWFIRAKRNKKGAVSSSQTDGRRKEYYVQDASSNDLENKTRFRHMNTNKGRNPVLPRGSKADAGENL